MMSERAALGFNLDIVVLDIVVDKGGKAVRFLIV
jgi:hypothetical protein